MNRIARFALAAALAVPALSSAAHAAEWELDPAHTTAAFTVKHMVVTDVRGEFGKVTGTVDFDPKNPTAAKVDVLIDAGSVDTRNEKRDAHLKSPDFFDVAKTPTITFKSTKVVADGSGKWKLTGDLTIHGVTKPVTLEVVGPSPEMKNPWGQTVVAFSATGKVNRKEFGLNWNKALEAGGVLVSDEVRINIDAEMTKKAPAAARK